MSNNAAFSPPISDTGGANNDEVDQESNKRSERKRRREKQRRSDLSSAFDELAAFIVQVEPSNTDNSTDKKGKKRKSSDGGEDSSGITRLDLIGRALRIMKRLYRENEERKRVISTIEGRGGGAGVSNDNVSSNIETKTQITIMVTVIGIITSVIFFLFSSLKLLLIPPVLFTCDVPCFAIIVAVVVKVIVMVPTLAPSGDDPPPVARAAYPGQYHRSGATVPYLHDPREYNPMAPPHHTAYTSHWATGRQPVVAASLSHLAVPGAVMRMPQHHQHITGPSSRVSADGLPLQHINQPPNQH